MNNLTWDTLRGAAVGTLLEFVQPHDIYPYCIVPAGTLAIVARVYLDGEHAIIDLLPADPATCKALKEWDGCIQFNPHNDGYSWSDESPVALHV